MVVVRRKLRMDPSLVNEKSKTGHTPLMVAAVRGDPEMIKYLLDNGAKVWLPDESDWTALHFAVLKDHVEATRLLLAYGADPSAVTRGSEPALVDMARSDEVKKLLQNAIAGDKPSVDEVPSGGATEADEQAASPSTNESNNKPKVDADTQALIASIDALVVEPDAVKVGWEEIAGLVDIKQDLEMNLLGAMQRPELFTGMLQPPHGILFFGPPGTGKTLLAKAIAKKCKARFYNLSASSLASKYVGDSEKLVKLLFDQAFEHQPCIIFFDEIDSVLRARSSGEEEWVRKLKNEFLVRLQEIQDRTREEPSGLRTGAETADRVPGQKDETARSGSGHKDEDPSGAGHNDERRPMGFRTQGRERRPIGF
ncbi:hypothetical protein CYMTET_4609 [Cymbomonas tetramitiformis]|uniref:AAA+ ATPase domain-containing protein n=1 Tax=Cymbomonas tetramitiformis TaxID=36881 RepID=A0AAE0H0U6_9CHLO|nr:hypothetical protein CYMTET_4609 [Cymbomonas tetramitiformis]